MRKPIGADAVATKGWWSAHRWLLLRRFSQLSILALFLLGPLAGIWLVKGNLNFSYTLDILPLTDPYVALQSLAAGHVPEMLGSLGVLIVLLFYFLVGGRVYCYLAERQAGKVVFAYLGKLAAGEIRRYEKAKKQRANYRKQIRDLKQQIRYLEKATRGE